MGAMRSLVEDPIVDAVRAELGRALDKGTDPVHTKIDDIIAEAARRTAKPVHTKVQALVDDAARRAVTGLLEKIWPEDKKPTGAQDPAGSPPKRRR
jgi:hypothetical protein